ncbi:hypothetical protein ABZZ79_29540 [Streptomyces sp. NPDC006458]|uniref:hypothetical protein n=1 Tax=Streptomyces sp. NPDC006458 TaxID=3154302 RepID=UPI0033AA3641
MNDETPQLAGDFWVYPSLGEVTGTSVRVNVAIAVEEPFVLQDTDVAVELVAGGQALGIAEAPSAGPLPAIQMAGTNAYALYRFDNPDGLAPETETETVTVTVRGASAAFDVSLPVV